MGSEQHRQGQKPAGAAGRPPAAGSPILRQLRRSPHPPCTKHRFSKNQDEPRASNPLFPVLCLLNCWKNPLLPAWGPGLIPAAPALPGPGRVGPAGSVVRC